MRRFEFVEGTSSKFWEVEVVGAAMTVRYGRIGTTGQTQEKAFPSDQKAQAEADKLIAEKVKKGYAETTIGAAATAAPAPAGATVRPPAAEPPGPPTRVGERGPGSTPVAATPPPPAPPSRGGGGSPTRIPPPPSEAMAASDGWIPVGDYAVSLQDGKLLCRNKQGKLLASVPKAVKDTDEVARLEDAREWLASHDAECRETVESWMLRSLPIPRHVIEAVWPDLGWRGPLENAVVTPLDDRGEPSGDAGILRGVDPARGVGVVTLDGETLWVQAAALALPHPILLVELDEWRDMVVQLGLSQGTPQLFRETFVRAPDVKGTDVDDYSGGEFPLLASAIGEARKLGYRVSGGQAICRVFEGGQSWEARYYLGEGDPMYETSTGDLSWVDGKQQSVDLEKVPPIAWSEGQRMAAAIYGKRTVEKKEEEDV